MSFFTREQCLERLRAQVASGKPILGGGAGTGISAKCAEAGGIDKGQKQELEAFVAAVKSGGEMPVPVGSLIATTAATFAVSRSIATRRPERVAAWSSWDAAEIETVEPPPSGAGAVR